MKNISAQDHVSVLTVQGDLDIETFPRLLRQAEACFDQGQFNLLIDLRQAGSISNGGLIALQTIAARAADRGGKTVFSGATPTAANRTRLTAAKASFAPA